MASGLPDYSSGIRPTYGHAMGSTLFKPVVANTDTRIFRMPGKGMIYGGAVWMDHAASQKDGVVWLLIDDSVITWLSFQRLHEFKIASEGFYALSLNLFDDVLFKYTVGIRYGLTFDESFEIRYDENNGGTPTVHYSVVYTLQL